MNADYKLYFLNEYKRLTINTNKYLLLFCSVTHMGLLHASNKSMMAISRLQCSS